MLGFPQSQNGATGSLHDFWPLWTCSPPPHTQGHWKRRACDADFVKKSLWCRLWIILTEIGLWRQPSLARRERQKYQPDVWLQSIYAMMIECNLCNDLWLKSMPWFMQILLQLFFDNFQDKATQPQGCPHQPHQLASTPTRPFQQSLQPSLLWKVKWLVRDYSCFPFSPHRCTFLSIYVHQ